MAAPVVVVSGLPRSGTSLMMRLVGDAGVPVLQDDARPPDASNPGGYAELAAVKRTRDDPSWLERAGGHAVKVISRLLEDLPRDRSYRVILMRRPVQEVVASQDRMLARLGEPPGALPPDRLAAVQAAQLREAIELLEREPCFAWLAVDYPALVADPVPVCRAVVDFLGVDADPRALAGRVDPTLYHERG